MMFPMSHAGSAKPKTPSTRKTPESEHGPNQPEAEPNDEPMKQVKHESLSTTALALLVFAKEDTPPTISSPQLQQPKRKTEKNSDLGPLPREKKKSDLDLAVLAAMGDSQAQAQLTKKRLPTYRKLAHTPSGREKLRQLSNLQDKLAKEVLEEKLHEERKREEKKRRVDLRKLAGRVAGRKELKRLWEGGDEVAGEVLREKEEKLRGVNGNPIEHEDGRGDVGEGNEREMDEGEDGNGENEGETEGEAELVFI